MLYSPFLHHFDLHILVRLHQRRVANAEIRPSAYLHKIANIPIDQSYPPVFSVPFAQRPRPRVGARCLQGNSAFDVIQLGTIEPQGAPPKSRTSSRINISMVAVVILSVRFSPSAVILSNNGCRGTKIGIEFDQHVLMISFVVQ